MHKIQITAELSADDKEGGYSVYCPEFDIYTQGENVEEAINNLKEAVVGYIKVVGIDDAFKEFKSPIRETVEVSLP